MSPLNKLDAFVSDKHILRGSGKSHLSLNVKGQNCFNFHHNWESDKRRRTCTSDMVTEIFLG